MSSPNKKTMLVDMAKVIRSKNSGPFKLTLDIIFQQPEDYLHVKNTGQLTPQLIAGLYGFDPDHITDILYFDPAYAIKIVMPRLIPSGSVGDTDVYGAQQHAPLLDLAFSMDR